MYWNVVLLANPILAEPLLPMKYERVLLFPLNTAHSVLALAFVLDEV